MNTLRDIVPNILIPRVPEPRPASPHTPSVAGYAPVGAPPQNHIPYWILYSPTLAGSMMVDLHEYLRTAPGGTMPSSPFLQSIIARLPGELLHTSAGELSTEETTTQLWDFCFWPIFRNSVQEVEQSPSPPTLVVRRTLYSQTPDTLICPRARALPRLHREDKSWAVFDNFAPRILALAQHVEDEQLGTSLDLRTNEVDERSILMKMGVSMIANLIPYGILFGGHKFMLFSLFRNVDTLGDVRYGLACSDIIVSTSTTTPLIPLVIYTLLRNTDGPVRLHPTDFSIPPVLAPVIQNSKPVMAHSRLQKFKSLSLKKVIVHTNTLDSATSKSLVLHCEPDASEVASSKAPSNDQIDGEISLTECIGHGATAQVYTGIAGDEKYILKIAPWKDGQRMLQREADIYEVLSELQGRCIPKIYGFFRSEHLKVLIMTYMGLTIMSISDLNMDQRHLLLEELCLIHEHGIVHGDLRAPNIVLQNGSDPHFIDFSHGYKHQCTGRTSCFELKEAHQFLLLSTAHLV